MMLTKRVMSFCSRKNDKLMALCVKPHCMYTRSVGSKRSSGHQSCSHDTIYNLISNNIPNVQFVKGKVPYRNINYYYVLCDVPEIKNFDKTLSYNILENDNGVIAFTSRHNLEFLRAYIKHPYHVVEVENKQLKEYLKSGKRKALAIHNCYSDSELKKTYFVFHEVHEYS